MKEEVSFIHAADLHLDSPFLGFKKVPQSIFKEIQDSTFNALVNLVEEAIKKKVDFVLLVGDLYDTKQQSLKAQVHLRKAFEKLQQHQIKVYLSYGNHDYIGGNIHQVAYPENVHIFPDEEVRKFIYKRNGKEIAAIQGFSYEKKSILMNKSKDYTHADDRIPFHIAMLHGNFQGDESHDPYAPFKMSDLLKINADYWALGHIHKRQILKKDPLVIYPGNIQGRHINEEGLKGCFYVKLTETSKKHSFLPLQAIVFTRLNFDISECKDIHQFEQKLQEKLHVLRQESNRQLIDLKITSNNPLHKEWENDYSLEEMIQIVNEINIEQKNWQYIFQSAFSIKEEEPWIRGDHFMGELTKVIQKASLDEYLAELYTHKKGRKFLNSLTEAEKEEIKREAYQLLAHKIYKNGGRFYEN